jgi:hypothetical protein
LNNPGRILYTQSVVFKYKAGANFNITFPPNQVLPFDTAVITSSSYNTTGYYFTVPVTGIYMYVVHIQRPWAQGRALTQYYSIDESTNNGVSWNSVDGRGGNMNDFNTGFLQTSFSFTTMLSCVANYRYRVSARSDYDTILCDTASTWMGVLLQALP